MHIDPVIDPQFRLDSAFSEINQHLQKVEARLSDLEKAYQRQDQSFQGHLPSALLQKSGKISRGNNYQGLPYLVLDYPRMNLEERLVLVRTFYWLDQFWSIALHLSGKGFQKGLATLAASIENCLKIYPDLHFSLSSDAWEQRPKLQYSLSQAEISREIIQNHFEKHGFFKLSFYLFPQEGRNLYPFMKYRRIYLRILSELTQ